MAETEAATVVPSVPRARGGRQARQAQRVGGAARHRITAGVARNIPTYELLSEEGLDRIEAGIDEILKEIGLDFRGDPEALDLWREAGANVKAERGVLNRGLVRSIMARTARKRFTHHARNPQCSVEIGDRHVVFSPA